MPGHTYASLADWAYMAFSVKTLLARSPIHLNSIAQQFRKACTMSLTKAIKQHFSGLTGDMLLFAVENAKHDSHDIGVCEYYAVEQLVKQAERSGYRA